MSATDGPLADPDMEPEAVAVGDATLKRAYIKRVELENFMSHRKFELDLSPDLNVIIGKNGSGKSSILTAIMVGAGARSSKTKRGDSIGDLIRHGAGAAYITLYIHNPQIYSSLRQYGTTIIVQRRITAKQSTYTLKDSDGHTVSRKSEDLRRILETIGFYPDNALAMLTQESAKEFLTQDSPKKKYTYLMDALRFTNIRDSMSGVQESIQANEKLIEENTANVKDTLRQAKQERAWLERAERAKDSDAQIALNQGVLAWRKVAIVEQSVEQNKQLVADLQKKVENMQREHDEIDGESISAKGEELNRGLLEVQQRISDADTDARNAARAVSEAEQEHLAAKEKLAQAEKHIADGRTEIDSLEVDAYAHEKIHKRQQLEQDAAMSTRKVAELSDKVEQLEFDVEALDDQRSRASEAEREMREVFDHEMERKKDLESTLRDLERSISSGPAAAITYAPKLKMDAVRAAIARERWTVPPVGPLGDHVKVKDAQFKPVLETLFANSLPVFLVQTTEDREKLLQIIRSKGSTLAVVLRKSDKFNFTNGSVQVSQDYTRIQDALEFDSEDILRYFVDNHRIESAVLVSDQETGFRVTDQRNRPRNLVFAYALTGRERFTRFGNTDKDLSESRVTNVNHNRTKMLEIRHDDTRLRQQKERIVEEVKEVSDLVDRLSKQANEAKAAHHAARNASQMAQSNLKKLQKELEDEKMKLRKYNEALEEQPVENADNSEQIAILRRQLEISERNYRQRQIRLEESAQKLQELQQVKSSSEDHLREVRKEEARWQTMTEELSRQSGQLAQKRQRILSDIARGKGKITTHEEQLATAASKMQQLTAEAIEFSQERPDLDEFQETDGEIRANIERLKQERESSSASGEEVERRRLKFNSIMEAVEEKKRLLERLKEDKKSLIEMHQIRQAHNEQTMQSALNTMKKNFSRLLGQRGFAGVLDIDEQKKTLEVRANPRKTSSNAAIDRSTATLSGGEKSFTQVSLLLSVWQSMAVSLVAMDEYDVFMDKVNRKVSLELLLDTVRSQGMQGILITPQDVNTEIIQDNADYVQIHRLDDPERNRT